MSSFYPHMILMILVFVLAFTAGIIAKFFRKKNYWLKVHKSINILKTFLSIFGFYLIFIFVNNIGIKHFSTIHGIIGLIAFIFIILQTSFGFISTNKYFSKFSLSKIVRKIHKNIGIFVLIIITINLILGLIKIF